MAYHYAPVKVEVALAPADVDEARKALALSFFGISCPVTIEVERSEPTQGVEVFFFLIVPAHSGIDPAKVAEFAVAFTLGFTCARYGTE